MKVSGPSVPLFALILAGLLSLAAAMGVGRFAFTPVLPLMLRDGLLDVQQGGWLAAANYAGYFVGALSAARMPLRAGALAVSSLLATAGLTAAMAWPWVGAWLPLRFLAGVASAWVFVATSVWCLGALARRGAAGAAGFVYAGVGVGIAVTGLYCMLTASGGIDPAALWMQLGALALGLALPVFWVIGRVPSAAEAAAQGQTGAARPAGDGKTRGLVVCYGAMGFGYILPATFLPVMAREVVHDPLLFGLAWPVFGAMAAISTVIAMRWLNDTHRVMTWGACQLMMGLGVLLPGAWANLSTITASALLVGGTFMVITLAGVQEMRARAGADAGRLVGRITAAFALGQIAGPVASSLLLHAGPQGLRMALFVGATVLLASGGWLLRAASSGRPLERAGF
ncbi:MAG: YbfB/YjiJ family MFS transporter [Burkholderiaceae bacterium]